MKKKEVDLRNRIFIRPSEIESYIGISKATVYRMVNNGSFPKQRHISERSTGWRRKDLDEFIQNLPEAS